MEKKSRICWWRQGRLTAGRLTKKMKRMRTMGRRLIWVGILNDVFQVDYIYNDLFPFACECYCKCVEYWSLSFFASLDKEKHSSSEGPSLFMRVSVFQNSRQPIECGNRKHPERNRGGQDNFGFQHEINQEHFGIQTCGWQQSKLLFWLFR